MKNKYFLLRHGQTEYQAKRKGILYRRGEKVELTKKGRDQIKKAAEKLEKENIDIVFSSDVYRTKETSKIVGKKIKKKVFFDKRLREVDFGDFHGKSKKSYRNYFLDADRFSKRPPKGESWTDIVKRLKSFLKEVERENKDKSILIVSHGDVLLLLSGIIKGEALGNHFNLGELKKYE